MNDITLFTQNNKGVSIKFVPFSEILLASSALNLTFVLFFKTEVHQKSLPVSGTDMLYSIYSIKPRSILTQVSFQQVLASVAWRKSGEFGYGVLPHPSSISLSFSSSIIF